MTIGRTYQGSFADRSWIHSIQGAFHSSTELRSRAKNAKKTGICSSSGRQPPAGFTPSALNSSCISSFILRWLSRLGRPFLSRCLPRYFCLIASIFGCSFCIFCIET